MRRFTLLICCLVAFASLGFWRLVARPEPFIHAQGVASVQVVDHRRIEQLERHLDQLIHEAEKLEQAGKHDHAEKVRHEAEKVEQHLHHAREQHEHANRAEHHEGKNHFAEAERKRDHLLEAAENLRQANKPELAEQLQHEAEEIERHLQHLREQEHGHHPHSPLEPIMHELHGLRKEVAELREQIHELQEVIEEAIEEHEDEADADGKEDLDISLFELEPGTDPIINANGLKIFIQQLGLQQEKRTHGKVQVHGKVQIKRGDTEDVQVFVFDQDDLEAGNLSKVLDLNEVDLNELKLGTGTKGLNLKSIIEQAVGKIPNADKQIEESKEK